MAYNTKSLLRDVDGKIVPQGFDLTADAYKALTGQDLGGGRFGLDGVQWGKTASGLFVPIKVTNDGAQEVQLPGTKVIQREITISTIPGGQVQTNIITPDSPSRLVGVFSNIRTEGNPTTGHLQMDVYVGDGSVGFLNRIARLMGDTIVSLRKILTIYPAGLESGTEVTLPSGVSNINDYLSHCSKFSFSPNAPLVVEISNTTDQPVSNPQLRRLVVWYTSI